jgi:hypothetical protein
MLDFASDNAVGASPLVSPPVLRQHGSRGRVPTSCDPCGRTYLALMNTYLALMKINHFGKALPC